VVPYESCSPAIRAQYLALLAEFESRPGLRASAEALMGAPWLTGRAVNFAVCTFSRFMYRVLAPPAGSGRRPALVLVRLPGAPVVPREERRLIAEASAESADPAATQAIIEVRESAPGDDWDDMHAAYVRNMRSGTSGSPAEPPAVQLRYGPFARRPPVAPPRAWPPGEEGGDERRAAELVRERPVEALDVYRLSFYAWLACFCDPQALRAIVPLVLACKSAHEARRRLEHRAGLNGLAGAE